VSFAAPFGWVLQFFLSDNSLELLCEVFALRNPALTVTPDFLLVALISQTIDTSDRQVIIIGDFRKKTINGRIDLAAYEAQIADSDRVRQRIVRMGIFQIDARRNIF
jgi:hypothetical protein